MVHTNETGSLGLTILCDLCNYYDGGEHCTILLWFYFEKNFKNLLRLDTCIFPLMRNPTKCSYWLMLVRNLANNFESNFLSKHISWVVVDWFRVIYTHLTVRPASACNSRSLRLARVQSFNCMHFKLNI